MIEHRGGDVPVQAKYLNRPCGWCMAGVGVRCRDEEGYSRPWVHMNRVLAPAPAALIAGEAQGRKVRMLFDPERIAEAFREGFSKALRMMADAVDAGEMEGMQPRVMATGFAPASDKRMHVMVSFRLCAELWQDVKKREMVNPTHKHSENDKLRADRDRHAVNAVESMRQRDEVKAENVRLRKEIDRLNSKLTQIGEQYHQAMYRAESAG